MTKNELLRKMQELLDSKGMTKIDNGGGKINANNSKCDIEGAIKCLEAMDDEMRGYLAIFKEIYPNTYNVIVNNGNWLTHSFNRYYVYNTARMSRKAV